MGAALTFGVLLGLSTTGCGGVECGKGTVEVDGICMVGKALECAAGFKANGDKCEPLEDWPKVYCDSATAKWENGKCVGTGSGPVGCPGNCPAPTASGVSLCGQVFDGVTLLSQWAGGPKATPVKGSDGAHVSVYDPLAFVANPTTAKPLNLEEDGKIDDNGCFYVKNVTIPFSGFFALAVDDFKKTDTKWAFVATGETPIAGTNSTGLEIPALTEAQITAWGNDLAKVGSMIMVYRDKTGKAVDGVSPTLEGKEWPSWDPNPATSKPYDLFFFSDDATKFDAGTSVTKTAKSGAVVVKQAQVKNHSGKKGTCTIESGLGGSSAGTLFFRLFDVSGC